MKQYRFLCSPSYASQALISAHHRRPLLGHQRRQSGGTAAHVPLVVYLSSVLTNEVNATGTVVGVRATTSTHPWRVLAPKLSRAVVLRISRWRAGKRGLFYLWSMGKPWKNSYRWLTVPGKRWRVPFEAPSALEKKMIDRFEYISFKN